ncbi:uncharacterized protein [Lolium perenne]|uniref:uncharacterized protein isoform X2 n=1 Tax=Lolium perenne TaxID=4522 RepID=UPI0021F5049D|nr:uncharacterized protein LOC127291822 isoform X2 [Lolium perenne]
MSAKFAGTGVILLLALLLSASLGASTKVNCTVQQAKDPSCPNLDDGVCAKQCKSEGFTGWMCVSNCTCISCPSFDTENHPETVELQKQGNRGVPAASVGADHAI